MTAGWIDVVEVASRAAKHRKDDGWFASRGTSRAWKSVTCLGVESCRCGNPGPGVVGQVQPTID